MVKELALWLERYDLLPFIEYIESMCRPAIALRAQPEPLGLVPHGSSIGGAPALPRSFEWPHEGGRPMVYLGRLQFSELSPFDVSGVAPPQGTLHIWLAIAEFRLWNPEDEPVIHVEYFEEEGSKDRRLPSPWSKAAARKWIGRDVGEFPVASLVPRAMMTFPENGDDINRPYPLSDDETDRLSAMSDAMIEEMTGGSLCQMLGHQRAVQGGDRGSQAARDLDALDPSPGLLYPDPWNWELLLQLDFDSGWFGDHNCVCFGSNMLYLWIERDRLRNADFSRVRLTTQMT